MKKLFRLVAILFVTTQLNSQEQKISTESVTLENLFTFTVEHFEKEGNPQNITFLLKTHASEFDAQDKFILKQTFMLLSKRLTEDDFVSIATYNNYNGIALKQSKPTELKKILYTIEHPKTSIKAFGNDGIELAYSYAKETYKEGYDNKVVMIRLPKREISTTASTAQSAQNLQPKSKGNGSTVVLTALDLLPEIIAVIKN